MPNYRERHARPSFPFLDLPAEVQVLVMSNVDIHTLQNLVRATPSARDMYLRYPTSILQGAVATMGLQFRNLLLTTYSLMCAINHANIYTKADITSMEAFLEKSLDTEEQRRIDLLEFDASRALDTLCDIDKEVTTFVQAYAEDIYERAYHRYDPGVVLPPLVLCSVETYRITRAFYRLKLFQVLFYNYADRFSIDFSQSEAYQAFFDRMSDFEMDEMVTAYQFALRDRRYFKSAYPHKGCTYTGHKPWRNDDPLHCETCRGAFSTDMRSLDSTPASAPSARAVNRRRRPQPFWSTLQDAYLSSLGLWAEPTSCRSTPMKEWTTEPEANGPNAGWLYWKPVRDTIMSAATRDVYVRHFRIFGFCFWDYSRLREWDYMFSPLWPFET
jgi:hypothetical protein